MITVNPTASGACMSCWAEPGAMKRNIREHACVAEIFVTVPKSGMQPLKQEGIEKALQPITDMKQVCAACACIK